MFGIGFTELSLILFVALVFIGPKKLPELAKTLGKAYSEFQKSFSQVKDEFENEVMNVDDEDDIKGDGNTKKEGEEGGGEKKEL